MRKLSQYMDNGKVAEVWLDKDQMGTRYVVRVFGQEDKEFETEFAAEQYADDYVMKPVKEVSINQVDIDFPEVELEYSLVQDPGVVKLKPVNQKSRKRIDKE